MIIKWNQDFEEIQRWGTALLLVTPSRLISLHPSFGTEQETEIKNCVASNGLFVAFVSWNTGRDLEREDDKKKDDIPSNDLIPKFIGTQKWYSHTHTHANKGFYNLLKKKPIKENKNRISLSSWRDKGNNSLVLLREYPCTDHILIKRKIRSKHLNFIQLDPLILVLLVPSTFLIWSPTPQIPLHGCCFFCHCSLASKNLCIASFHKFCCHLMYLVCVFFVTYRSPSITGFRCMEQ